MATTYREDLVKLLQSGTPKVVIMAHFMSARHISAKAAIEFLRSAGIGAPMPDPNDSITDDRRRYLQDLSIT
jgi:L-lysine 2,3-aminomutase